MKKIIILLMVLSGFMALACSSDAEELDKKEETTVTDTVNTFSFTDEFVDASTLPGWLEPTITWVTVVCSSGLDIYRGEYNNEAIYMTMSIEIGGPDIIINGKFSEINNDIRRKSKNWKRIYSWRPDEWHSFEEEMISIYPFFDNEEMKKKTLPIYYNDELVSTSELPAWLVHDIDYYTKEHQMGLDIYRCIYKTDTVYMTMTEAYSTPCVYDSYGKYVGATLLVVRYLPNWKRIFSWRPDDWSDFWEEQISPPRFFQHL